VSETYAWRGGTELLLRHGEGSPVTLVILPALFEEANRMRRFTVSLMRSLAKARIGSVLPDLPGTGESTLELADVTLDDWLDAAAALSNAIRDREGRVITVAIRGGALLDGTSDARWRLAPETGERLLRDLVRATAVTGGISAGSLDVVARQEPTRLAGNLLSPMLYRQLADAPFQHHLARTIRLEGDAAAADMTIAGSRLWRASEPGDDPEMVAAAVADICSWVSQCVA
jgi:pimeloyl-ACP methyl ester carboxylesterase